jgi:hypothetical protein
MRVPRFLTGPEDVARQADRGVFLPPEVRKSSDHKSHAPAWLFYFHTMSKKKKLLPKQASEWHKLQMERAQLKHMLYGNKPYTAAMDRAQCAKRLIEVNRALNKLAANGYTS